MEHKHPDKKKSIKEEVLEDFLINKAKAEELGYNCLPTGYLKYYLTDKAYPTYAGRIIKKYCKDNNIKIMKANELGITEFEGEKVHHLRRFFVW
jgi:hypothetical protein